MRRVVRAAAGRLAAACTVAFLLTYAAHVIADAHLSAPAPTPWIADRRGGYLTQAGHEAAGRVEYGYWTTPPPARVAALTLALEDRRFAWHPGVDPLAVLRAAWGRVAWHRASGASTIAMQVARMQHPRPRTLWAKALEAGTAVALTARYGRDAVLAQYLRLAPYGNGSHGIGHAARWYFGKPAADLSLAEAALLSAIPQAPALANPHRPSGLLRARARAARALDALPGPPDDLPAARQALAVLRPAPRPVQPADAMHAALRLRRLARQPEAAPDPADPRLRAALDPGVQADATRIARAHLASWRGAGAQQVAVLVVRRRTREVAAIVGSAGWTGQPGTPGGRIDFTAADRSPGSTLKPFLYALALDRGVIAAGDPLPDAPEIVSGIGNADGAYLGPLLPRQALANSRNVPAAALLRRIGLRTGFEHLRALGLHRLDGPADRFGLAMAIGALPTGLDRLVRAYGALADDGMLADLSWFADLPAPPPRRVLSVDSARLVAAFLSDPLARLPSFPRYGASEYPFAVALKTGTSQGYRDAWTVAWSADWMVGAWVGRADDGPMADGGTGLAGARSAARLAQSLLMRLHGAARTDLQAGTFPTPPGRIPTELCASTGRAEPCSQRLTEFQPAAGPPSAVPQPSVPAPQPAPRLTIVQPEFNAHVWRNPEAPQALNKLVLRAVVDPPVPQVLWLVDGQPAKLLSPDEPFQWPMVPGQHRFQLRLPLEAAASHPVRVVVE